MLSALISGNPGWSGVGQPIQVADPLSSGSLEFLHFGADFLTVPPRVDQGRGSCLVSGHGFSRAVGGSQFRALAPAAFLLARYMKQYGNSSDLSASPAFTGFAAVYSRCLMQLCRHSTRVSEKPRCQTSPQWPHSFFKRYENPPLTNCLALSTVMPSPAVTNKCRWSGITTKSWSRNFLAAT